MQNIRALEDRYELVLLDYNILTSPKKLMDYQRFYFEEKFNQKNIKNISTIEINDKKLKIEKLVKIDE